MVRFLVLQFSCCNFPQTTDQYLLYFSLNHVFTEIHFDNISDQQSISAEVVRVLIHGHSLYDEAAFYELYMTDAIDSKRSLDNFIGSLIPGFKGLTEKQFDLVMSKWLYHLLAQFWTRSFQTGRSFAFRPSTICLWNCSFRYQSIHDFPDRIILWLTVQFLFLNPSAHWARNDAYES